MASPVPEEAGYTPGEQRGEETLVLDQNDDHSARCLPGEEIPSSRKQEVKQWKLQQRLQQEQQRQAEQSASGGKGEGGQRHGNLAAAGAVQDGGPQDALSAGKVWRRQQREARAAGKAFSAGAASGAAGREADAGGRGAADAPPLSPRKEAVTRWKEQQRQQRLREQLFSRSCSSINGAWCQEVSRGLRERPANFRNQCLRGGQGNEGHASGACVLALQHPREASISRGLACAMFIHLFTPSRYDRVETHRNKIS